MRIRALTCDLLQNSKFWTQNPPTLAVMGVRPPSRHQQNKEFRLKWPLQIGEAKIVWWLFSWLLLYAELSNGELHGDKSFLTGEAKEI
jgi:hypothetical protein